MPEKASNDPLQEAGTQSLIVLQLLRPEHERPATRVQLQTELYDIDPDALTVALACLSGQGVIQREGERLRASACAHHLDALDLISI